MTILDEFIEEIKKFGLIKLSRMSGICLPTIRHWVERTTTPSIVNAQKAANTMGLEFLLFEKE